MATEPTINSLDDIVTQQIMEQPTPQETNQSEVAETTIEEPQDVETEIEVEATESDDVADFDGNEAEIEIEDEDESEDDAAVPLELSDDYELEYKSNGEMRKATIGELKRSAAGQDYIQKGMEDNANVRKELEKQSMSMQEDRNRLNELLTMLDNPETVPVKPVMPSKELQASDPLVYLESMEQYRQDLSAFENFKTEALKEVEKSRQQQFAAQQKYAKEQAEILRQEIPELQDAEKSKQLMVDIKTVATDFYHVPEQVLSNLVHGWEFKILKDAVAYRKLQDAKGKVTEKTKLARPKIKSGAKKSASATKVTKQKAARSKMQTTGGIDDVASYLLS